MSLVGLGDMMKMKEGGRGSGKMKEFTRGGSFLDLGELEEQEGILHWGSSVIN
jgi:hypothetical protein